MYRRIFVPTDGSPTAQCGVDQAIAIARDTGAAVRFMFVLDDLAHVTGFESYAAYASYILPHLQKMGHDILEAAVGQARKAGIDATSYLIEAAGHRVSPLVLCEARGWRADLIVIGSHGRRGADRFFLGSDAEQIVRHAEVPVLVVRDPGKADARTPADHDETVSVRDISTIAA